MPDLRLQQDVAARGEAALVGALAGLPAGFVVIPHVTLPRVQWQHDPDDLDAIVLGPGGILLVEYKHWHGLVEMDPEPEPWRLSYVTDGEAGAGEVRPNPIPLVRTKVQALEAYLGDRGIGAPELVCALAFPDRTERIGTSPVPVLSLSELAPWIARQLSVPDPVAAPGWLADAADQLRPAAPVRTIHQYQITACLDRQSDRTSYLAQDGSTGRPVLLTEHAFDPYASPDSLDRLRRGLLREAKLAMGLSHPHIVQIQRVIPRDDAYYVVSEWVEHAQPLTEILPQGRISLDTALEIALAIASALEYAHGQGVVHRDLRPEHVLVAGPRDGKGVTVKITDFAMAKKADLGTRSTFDLRQMAQESPYVAPEFKLGQEGHHQVDARADIFALGVILYQMLTGELPGHLDERYLIPPSRMNPQVPPALDEAIAKAIKFDPAQRFSTMTAFHARLQDARAGTAPDPDAPRLRYIERTLFKRTRNSLIYAATDRKLGRRVALKKLLVDPAVQDRKSRERQLELLLREAQLASTLVHPHVVAVFDHFIEDDDAYLVMEWLEGADLREYLDGRLPPLTVPQVLSVIRQVGEALHDAHSHGIVHRDIKPENVILHEGQATVLDFGIARKHEALPGLELAKTAGTARYLAPEVLCSGEGDARSDVFSLGVLAFELLTHRYPYGPNVILGGYARDQVAVPIAPSQLNMAVFPELDPVIQRALAVDPELRHPSMKAFLDALAMALDGDTRPAAARTGATASRRRPVMFLGMLVAAGALGLYSQRHELVRWIHRTHRFQAPANHVATGSVAATVPDRPATMPPASASHPLSMPQPTPTAPAISWLGAPVLEGPLVGELEAVIPQGQQTLVRLWVADRGPSPVDPLGARSGALRVVDDLGHDDTPFVAADAPTNLPIAPGATASVSFHLRAAVDPRASLVTVFLTDARGHQLALKGFRLAQ